MVRPMDEFRSRLAGGGVLLLDGATGTELERRGAPMNDEAWCALATEAAPATLRAVHEDYLRAGADIITANTYASSRIMLEAAGMGHKVASLNRQAVEIAMEARERAAGGRTVAVAGSISNMMPMAGGAAHLDPTRRPALEATEESYREQAGLLAEAGVDLLLLEMHYRPELLERSIRAARATGLPVWVGTSARGLVQDGTLRVLSFADEAQVPYAEVIEAVLAAGGGEILGVMHTNVSVIAPALDILRAHHAGPLMAYPDSGHFEMPHWRFSDAVGVGTLVDAARGWLDQGVQVIGTCCGLGVDHVRALRALSDARAGGR